MIVRAAYPTPMWWRPTGIGFEFVGSTPEQFATYIKSEIKKWEKVVKASGAKPE